MLTIADNMGSVDSWEKTKTCISSDIPVSVIEKTFVSNLYCKPGTRKGTDMYGFSTLYILSLKLKTIPIVLDNNSSALYGN